MCKVYVPKEGDEMFDLIHMCDKGIMVLFELGTYIRQDGRVGIIQDPWDPEEIWD